MSAPVTEHEIEPHPDNDPSHPIPYLKVIDVATTKIGGGADLIIIVASPLLGDPRSQARLLDKIEGYLVHISSSQFQSEAGIPTPDNTTVSVVLHPGTAPEIYDLLERSKAWVLENNASLVLETLDSRVH